MTVENKFDFEDLKNLVGLEYLIKHTEDFPKKAEIIREHYKLAEKYKLYGPKTPREIYGFISKILIDAGIYGQMREMVDC